MSPALARGETVDDFSALDDRLEDMELEKIDYSIDRESFEDFAQGYLRSFPELVNGCLSAAGIPGNQVDLVVLTGGHSRWYFVREILSGKLDRLGKAGLTKIQADPGRVISITLPEETVALGLAYSPLRMERPHIHEDEGRDSVQIQYYIDTDSCLFCGSCADVCPVDAIHPGGICYVIDASSCVECGACTAVCPTDAIKDCGLLQMPLSESPAKTPQPEKKKEKKTSSSITTAERIAAHLPQLIEGLSRFIR